MTTKDSMPPNHNPASLTREDFVLVSHTECCKHPLLCPLHRMMMMMMMRISTASIIEREKEEPEPRKLAPRMKMKKI